MIMMSPRKVSFVAALALSALPVLSLAGEAPATSAAAQADMEKELATAQQQLEAASRRVAELSRQMGRSFNFKIAGRPGEGPPPRALLGVSIGPDADKEGAHVMGVSPGGAAAEAGIKVGDIIINIANVDLTKDSNPGRALVEKVGQLEPEQKVNVAVLRDGKKLNFEVSPRSSPRDILELSGFLGDLGGRMAERFGSPDGPGGRGPDGPGLQGRRQGNPQVPLNDLARTWPNQANVRQQLETRFGNESDARFDGAEFATLSDRLGSYFGVKAGVLVVRAGVNSSLKLQDGDVILSIDGRDATSAQQAGRILRSYQPGEKLTLKVQRDRKAQNIDGKAPGGRRSD
jgi:membrane-associated protease RseP (regulator of RpoE activity)